MLVSLTVGKVDAGVAVLLTEDKRIIEFPSILLPPSISSGSIVDITVSRNTTSEHRTASAFQTLQQKVFTTYGTSSPSPPLLKCRNATQTSIVLEWAPLSLATATLRSLTLFRNNSKAGTIPRPLDITSTKISGLAVDTAYTFYLVLRTSAGTYVSEKLSVKTHKMTDLSGITVTPGFLPSQLRASLQGAVERIGGRVTESVRIDTTHFVCTEGRGREWERAMEMNIPVVRPEWVEGCEREGRIVGVRGYYLNADPKLRQVGQGVGIGGGGGGGGGSGATQQGSPQPTQQLQQQQQPQPQPQPQRPQPQGRTDSAASVTSAWDQRRETRGGGVRSPGQTASGPATPVPGGAGPQQRHTSIGAPPTPAKDGVPAKDGGDDDDGEEEEEEDEDGSPKAAQAADEAGSDESEAEERPAASGKPQTRNLVGGGRGPASPDARGGEEREEGARGLGLRLGGEGPPRRESDGGNFSEVAL